MKVLITGASSGIGLALAKKLQEKNYTIVGLARSSLENNFIHEKVDLSDLKNLPNFLEQLTLKHADTSALILNAGALFYGALEQLSYLQIEKNLNVNFLSSCFIVKAFLPLFKKRKSGDIIFLGSTAALKGKKGGSIYSASKFALRGFAQALREECATSNIRVSIVEPDLVQTSFYDNLSFRPKKDHALEAIDVANVIDFILHLDPRIVLDEVILSSQKKALDFSKEQS